MQSRCSYLPAHELDELLADGEAEAGAEWVLDALVGDLGEEAEEALHVLLADPDARVLHRQVQPQVVGKLGLQRRGHDDAPLRRELDRVEEQVEQHLHARTRAESVSQTGAARGSMRGLRHVACGMLGHGASVGRRGQPPHLAQALLVADDKGGQLRVDRDLDLDALVQRVHLDDLDGGEEHLVQVEDLGGGARSV